MIAERIEIAGARPGGTARETLPRRAFGKTGARFSEIGLGCASYWGMARFSERTAIALVHEALELGLTVFDTGSSYSGGNAEPRLGRALRGRNKDELLISSKAGTVIRNGRLFKDFSARSVADSVDASLRRLELERLPLLYLHGCPPDELTDELRTALLQLRQAGKLRWVGLNSFDTDALQSALDDPLFDAVMLDYNVLRPERVGLIRALRNAGKAVVAGTSLARATYAMSPLRVRRAADIWYWARALATSRSDLSASRKFRFLREVPGWSAAQIALRYVLDNPDVDCAMFGTTKLQHLRENAEATRRRLDAELAARLSARLP